MSIGMPGNAVIVNLAMRWPILVPVAAASAITVVNIPPVAVPTPPAPVPVVMAAPPKPVQVPVIPAIEVVCPPYDKVVKLSKKEKQELRHKGCKIRG